MSDLFPRGEIEIAGRSAKECTDLLRERFAGVRDGTYPLRHEEGGRLVGRVRANRFTMSFRLARGIHSGAFVVTGTVDEASGGAVIRYRARMQRFTLAFWVLWVVALLGVIALSLGAPDADSTGRVTLATIIVLLVPLLVWVSLRRGRSDAEIAVAELRGWFGHGESAPLV